MSLHSDLIVIGAGPAGWGAALQGAKLGLSVRVVDRGAMIGGACVHTGTIPSKALRETVIRLMNVRRSAQLGLRSVRTRSFSVRDLMGPTDALVHHHADTVQSFFERNQVELVRGTATFVGPREIRVATGGETLQLAAERIIIAAGSKPRRPDTIPFDDRILCDSDSILSLDVIPRSLGVLGGGVIGCEYACIFATLGVKVTLVDRRETLLRFLDREILDQLHHRMRRMGVRLLLGEEVASVRVDSTRREPQAAIELKSGRVVRCDRLLAAAGREPNTEHLELARAGVQTQENGEIKVDEFYRTSAEGVYAVGDVIGFPALAGTSMHQGRVATLHAHGREVQAAPDLPLAVYTIPEISMVGLTEEACRTRGIVYEVGVARYGEIPRGQICGDTEGLLKIVFRREDHVVLGVHLIGEGSSELVHFGMALVHAGGRIDQLASAVFNYPTLSEAYRIAALDGLNRL